jgi:predicted phosphodiesterase
VTLKIHWRQRHWLQAQLLQPWEGPTVVITHHAPSPASIAPAYRNDWLTPAFASELPAEMFEGVDLWVHGHTHTSFDYRIGSCRVVCNPRGYPLGPDRHAENPGFDPGLVIEI